MLQGNQTMVTKYLVIREACLMEDEGKDHHIGVYNTREEAEAKVAEWISDGYFKQSDMKIVELNK